MDRAAGVESGISKRDPVEEVVHLHPQNQLRSFGDPELLAKRHVGVVQTMRKESVSADCSVGCRAWEEYPLIRKDCCRLPGNELIAGKLSLRDRVSSNASWS